MSRYYMDFHIQISGPKHGVTAMGESLVDDRLIVSGSRDGGIILWDLDLDSQGYPRFIEKNVMQGHSAEVTDVKLSLDGKYFVTCSKDKQIFIWDISKQAITHKLTGHTDEVLSVSISSDSKMIVSGSKDKTLKFWDSSNGKCTNTVKDADIVSSVCFSPNLNSNFVISGGYDKTVKRWDISKFATTHVAKDHTDVVQSVTVSGDGTRCASAGKDKIIYTYDTDQLKKVSTIKPEGEVYKLLYTQKRLHLSAATSDNFKIWDCTQGDMVLAHLQPKNKTTSKYIAWDYYSEIVFIVNEDDSIDMWRCMEG